MIKIVFTIYCLGVFGLGTLTLAQMLNREMARKAARRR